MTAQQSHLLAFARASASADAPHLLGSLASDDLNVNMLRFTGDDGIESHINREVDVLLVALDGEGLLTVDGEPLVMTAGDAVIVPKGAERSVRSHGERFGYLTCHGRRRGLMPTVRTRAAEQS